MRAALLAFLLCVNAPAWAQDLMSIVADTHQGGGVSPFLADNFTGSSGTLLSAHSPNTGGAWSKLGCPGDDIQLDGSGRITGTTSSTECEYSNAATPNSANQTATFQVTCGTTSQQGVLFRIQSVGNYYEVDVNGFSLAYEIRKYVSGTPTVNASHSALCSGTETLTAVLSGNTMTVSGTGTDTFSGLTFTDTSSPYTTAGTVGVDIYNNITPSGTLSALSVQ